MRKITAKKIEFSTEKCHQMTWNEPKTDDRLYDINLLQLDLYRGPASERNVIFANNRDMF